ncbi:Histone deacetylase clr6 [Psilocybe cubensis]|uniref:Histone deacetylase clr6 n=2 Tax=Psilocybe cubensis TaxID=181762 RepID=A0ACB8H2P9_PSICU|nr:Histone deacetylase clr6 [Psilocybe cubensis]KAH9482183.1 Histone deacetylase clr6 [Psilocybe cubensis]
MKPHRMRITHELATAYGMLDKMHVLRPKRATPEAMTAFHTDEYVQFLHSVTPETADKLTGQKTRFLVGDDNPAFEGVFEFCSISAGGSIGAAERIASGAADIAINWAGGLHHAKKREAAGFCYINDIVLGILELLRTYPRVLYIDIDCHHGDGVEEAFYTTDRVMTCSFHKFGEFFPGTGTQEDTGTGKGKGYSVNVPLKDGIQDESFKSVFDPVISKILEVFQPSAVVLQCGADSLAGDKLGCLNLTMQGHAHCVQFLRKSNIPLILLGGGGYTVKNVARAWTYETACAIGIENEIDLNMPWSQYFEWFGPTYRLEVPENNMEDMNVKEGTLDHVRTTALAQLQQLASRCAPSVQMQDVPRTSLGGHLGFKRDKREHRDELDERLAQHTRYLYDLQESESESEDTESSDSDASSVSFVNNWRRAPHRANSLPRILSGRHSSNPPGHISASERRRMSIVTGKYFDIPIHESGYNHYEYGAAPTKSSKRIFFQSGLDIYNDDNDFEGIINARTSVSNGFGNGIHDLHGLMERGGRSLNENLEDGDDEVEGEEYEDDAAMSDS